MVDEVHPLTREGGIRGATPVVVALPLRLGRSRKGDSWVSPPNYRCVSNRSSLVWTPVDRGLLEGRVERDTIGAQHGPIWKKKADVSKRKERDRTHDRGLKGCVPSETNRRAPGGAGMPHVDSFDRGLPSRNRPSASSTKWRGKCTP